MGRQSGIQKNHISNNFLYLYEPFDRKRVLRIKIVKFKEAQK